MSKHTPGPWKVRSTGEVGTERKLVAVIYPIETSKQRENIANAHLIASAPELLEACREALGHIEEGTESYNFIDTAITKTEGK